MRSPPASVPDAVAPPPRHPRFPQIDGLRAFAALSIVVVHAALQGGVAGGTVPYHLLARLDIGVTVFFLISGFLLYRPFIAHRGGGPPRPAVADYAKRRFLRIYPAYWVVLTVLVIVPGVMGTTETGWPQSYGLIHAVPLGAAPGCIGLVSECGLAQTWSLAVEVTFYACLPLYALLAACLTRGRSERSWMRIESALLAGVVGIWLLTTYLLPADQINGWVAGTLVGFMLWFALGMAVAVISVRFARANPQPWLIRAASIHPSALWLMALASYVAFSLWVHPAVPTLGVSLEDRLVTQTGYAVIAGLMLLAAVFGAKPHTVASRILVSPVVAWLGLISYGIFLWHYVFVLEFGGFGRNWGFTSVLLATLALTIPCAAASYYLVERPILRLKYRRLRDLIAGDRRANGVLVD